MLNHIDLRHRVSPQSAPNSEIKQCQMRRTDLLRLALLVFRVVDRFELSLCNQAVQLLGNQHSTTSQFLRASMGCGRTPYPHCLCPIKCNKNVGVRVLPEHQCYLRHMARKIECSFHDSSADILAFKTWDKCEFKEHLRN